MSRLWSWKQRGMKAVCGMMLLAAVGIPACAMRDGSQQSRVATKSGDNPESRVARGKYLVAVTGCNDCHTPFKMGAMGPEPVSARRLCSP